MAERVTPRESLIRNLRYLMTKEGLSEEELAKKAGVAQKTINNMLNQKHSPKLETVEAVAHAFGLEGWHLIMPNLPSELIESQTIAQLYENYRAASAKGRELIDLIAEREASTR